MPSIAGQTSREPVSPTMAYPCSWISRTACPAGPMSRSRPCALRRGLTPSSRPARQASPWPSVNLVGRARRYPGQDPSLQRQQPRPDPYIETVNDATASTTARVSGGGT
jgi:hypothetical protein